MRSRSRRPGCPVADSARRLSPRSTTLDARLAAYLVAFLAASLAPAPAGSSLTLSGTVEVRIPLVGGRVEKYICDQIIVEIPALQRFTSDWISRNA